MKKLLFIVSFFFCIGCTSLDKDFVNTVDGAWKLIGPKYMEYVINDVNLEDVVRNARIKHAHDFGLMIEDAKKLIE